jgi:hypothetical protein
LLLDQSVEARSVYGDELNARLSSSGRIGVDPAAGEILSQSRPAAGQ